MSPPTPTGPKNYDAIDPYASDPESTPAPNLRKPNLEGYLVWTQGDFESQEFGEAFWVVTQQNLQLSKNPNLWRKPAADVGFIVLPDLKAEGYNDTEIISRWYTLITNEMSPLQKRIFAPEINRLITLTASFCGVRTDNLSPVPKKLNFVIARAELEASDRTLIARDAASNEYVQVRFDATTFANLKIYAAQSDESEVCFFVPCNNLLQPVLLQRHSLASDATYGIRENPDVIGLATQDQSVQIISMGLTQPPPSKTDLFLQFGWTIAASFSVAAAMRNAATSQAAYNASIPVRFPTQDVSYYVKGPITTGTPPPAVNHSTTLWTKTPIEVDAPPAAKPTTSGPLRLPTSSTSGSGGVINKTSSGRSGASGNLETAGTPQTKNVAVPKTIPPAAPATNKTASTDTNSKTDTVGSAIYRFDTAPPPAVVNVIQNNPATASIRPTPPSPQHSSVVASEGLAHTVASVSAPPVPVPLPPIAPGFDPETDIAILPSADLTELFDAPAHRSSEFMILPARHVEDFVIEAPGADSKIGEEPICDAPVAADAGLAVAGTKKMGKQAQAFVADAQRLGWKEVLQPLLRSLFNRDEQTIEDDMILLVGHEHLVPDWIVELAESIDRKSANRATRATSYADAILRWDEFVKQGADEASREGVLAALKSGRTIEAIPDYVQPGTLVVQQSKVRNLRDADIAKLTNHGMIGFLETNFLDNLDADANGLIVDLLGELPKKVRALFLESLSLTYDPITEEIQKDGVAYELTPDDYANVLLALATIVIERQDSKQLASIAQVALSFLYKYLYATMPAFRKATDKIRELITEISDLKAGQNDKATELLSALYKTTQELYSQIFVKADLDALVQSLVSRFLTKAPSDAQVRHSLAIAGIALPTDVPTQEAMMQARAELEAELRATPATAENAKKRAELTKKLKAFQPVDRTEVATLAEVTTWRQFQDYGSRVLSGAAQTDFGKMVQFQLDPFLKTQQDFASKLQSFGMYFEEQALNAETTLHLTPVKGILAAVAIDTGSDCGQGKATDRAFLDQYGVAMITTGAGTISYGYIGALLLDSQQGPVVTIDALNPSTQLDLSGPSFLEAVQRYYTQVLQGSPYPAVLISRSSDLVSNRESIAKASEAANYPTAQEKYGALSTPLLTDKETATDLLNELSEVDRHLLAAKLRTTATEDIIGKLTPLLKTAKDLKEKISHEKGTAATKLSEALSNWIDELELLISTYSDLAHTDINAIYENYCNLSAQSAFQEMTTIGGWLGRSMGISPAITREFQRYQFELDALRSSLPTAAQYNLTDFRKDRTLFILSNLLQAPDYEDNRFALESDENDWLLHTAETTYYFEGDAAEHLTSELREPRNQMHQQSALENMGILLEKTPQ